MRKVRHGSLLHWRVLRGGEVIASGQQLGWFTEISALDAARRAAEPFAEEGDELEVFLPGARISDYARAG